MFVNNEFETVYDKKTLDEAIVEAGFDLEELFAAMLSYHAVDKQSVE